MPVNFIVPVMIRRGIIMIVDTLEIGSIIKSKIKNYIEY
jgi:hypothetical protein